MSTTLKPATGLDVQTIVTNHFITQLEKGEIPWHASFYEQGPPQNLVNGRRYTGLNTWLLASLGYKRNLFLTWKQIRDQGLRVNKGQKGHMVVYWMPGTAEKKLRYYLVFNVAQTNIPADKIPPVDVVVHPKTVCEDIISSMPKTPAIDEGGSSLFYNPESDTVHMPAPEFVPDYRDYHSALFYALIHSTAHPSRLHREACLALRPHTPKQYSESELIFEMGASYLCSVAGIPPIYLKDYAYETEGWLRKLHTDKTILMSAAAHAQQAVQFVLNTSLGNGTDDMDIEE